MTDPSFRGNVNLDANVDVSVNLDVDVERARTATDEGGHGHENKYVLGRWLRRDAVRWAQPPVLRRFAF